MQFFEVTLFLATLLCGLVAGFLFAFAVVVMPGIRSLDDAAFLRAFKVMDGVIQNGHPLFLLAWPGSVLALLSSLALGFGQLDAVGLWLLGGATGIYLLAVQLPTAAINLPLNNTLKRIDLADMDAGQLAAARRAFEGRWNASNLARTFAAAVVLALLLVLLLRL